MENDGINVLSLFDGMSCGRIALQRAGISVDKYYSSEIDKHAIKVADANWPQDTQNRLGDVTEWRNWDIDWSSIDLLIGGSPCQGFSFAGKQLAFDDPRSKLFFTYVDILNHIKKANPDVKFMLENVKMKKEHLDAISEILGVEPVFINSSLLSAQNRQRYYWCNWSVPQPEDKGIMLADILETEGVGILKDRGSWRVKNDKANCITASYWKGVDNHAQRTMVVNSAAIVGRKINENGVRDDYSDFPTIQTLEVSDSGKSRCLSTVAKDTLVSSLPPGRYQNFNRDDWRMLTPIECERLQTISDNYTNHVSNTQRYKMLGNGWTVDVIAHILRGLKEKEI